MAETLPPQPRLRRGEQAGKNSFPQTPFLFARLLGLRPEIFLRGYKSKGWRVGLVISVVRIPATDKTLSIRRPAKSLPNKRPVFQNSH